MKFKDVPVGEKFFDPDCGETFEKLSGSEAIFTSGGNYFVGEACPFDPDDEVEPEPEPEPEPASKQDDHTICVGEWRFQVAGNTAYVSHKEHPGDIRVQAMDDHFAVQVFDDAVEDLKGELVTLYNRLGPKVGR